MALLLLFILILSTTSTDAVQCLPGEGFGLLTKRGFYKGSYPGYGSCPSGKPIDNYKDCSKAAHLLYSNAYFFTSYDRTKPTGCSCYNPFVDTVYCYYNSAPRGFGEKRSYKMLCEKDVRVSSVCPVDTYSLGGECANCTKCPPERPFTCDRKGCTVTGAIANVTCRAGPICSPGSSLQNQTLRTKGKCARNIHSEKECKKRAMALGLDVQHVYKNDASYVDKGCYYNTQLRALQIFDSQTECTPFLPCLCASKICTLCSPGFYSESGAKCVACPPSRPYTGSDGKATGTTSLSACRANITCKPGYTLSVEGHPTKVCTKCPFNKPLTTVVGRFPRCTGDFSCPSGEEGVGYAGGDRRSYGQCEELITDESDCRQAALYQNKMSKTNGEIRIANDIDDGLHYDYYLPKGCYFDSVTKILYFNSHMTNLGTCNVQSQCLCARTQNLDMPCKTCAVGRYSPARTHGYLNVTCQNLPACGTNGRLWQVFDDRYRKTKSCRFNPFTVTIFVVILFICCWRCSVWCRKNERKRANVLFRKDIQDIAELNLRVVSIDRYEPPLMSDVANVDKGASMNAASHDDLFTYLETAMLSATNSAELVSLFKTAMSIVDSADGKEALAGKKQALLSTVAVIRRRADSHSGNALWTKEVAQEFRKVLSCTV